MTAAAAAVHAAEHRHAWGRDATMRYLIRRRCPMRLYQLACALAGEV